MARKVVAADRAGADVFVSPRDQFDVARDALPPGSDMEIVGAATFDDALAALTEGIPMALAPAAARLLGADLGSTAAAGTNWPLPLPKADVVDESWRREVRA